MRAKKDVYRPVRIDAHVGDVDVVVDIIPIEIGAAIFDERVAFEQDG